MNLVTPEAGAKHELLFNKLASDLLTNFRVAIVIMLTVIILSFVMLSTIILRVMGHYAECWFAGRILNVVLLVSL